MNKNRNKEQIVTMLMIACDTKLLLYNKNSKWNF